MIKIINIPFPVKHTTLLRHCTNVFDVQTTLFGNDINNLEIIVLDFFKDLFVIHVTAQIKFAILSFGREYFHIMLYQNLRLTNKCSFKKQKPTTFPRRPDNICICTGTIQKPLFVSHRRNFLPLPSLKKKLK